MAGRFLFHGRYLQRFLAQNHKYATVLGRSHLNLVACSCKTPNRRCLSMVQDPEEASRQNTKHTEDDRKDALSQNIISQIFEEDETIQDDSQNIPTGAGRDQTKFVQSKEQKIVTEETLAQYVDALEEEVASMDGTKLNSVAKVLLTLTADDIPVVQKVENRLLDLLGRMPVKQVFNTLEIHKIHCTTALRTQVYTAASNTLELRWVEISDPKLLVSLFYHMEKEKSKDKVFDHLESKALEYAEVMEPKDLYRVMYSMSRRKKRNAPLIRALTYYLTKQTINLSPIHLTNLVFACSRLSIYDENLLGAVSVAVTESSNMFSKEQAVALLKSFRLLRWNDSNVMDSLTNVILSGDAESDTSHLAALLLSCGSNNYMPPNVKDQLPQIVTRLECLVDEDPAMWLNVVWSCCILGQCSAQTAASVLNTKFQDILMSTASDNDSMKAMNVIRSRNVNAYAQVDISGYTGPTLDTSKAVKAPSKSARHLSSHVVATLNTIAPANNYLVVDNITPDGHLIDVELVVNASGEPQQLAKFKEGKLIDGHHRVAVKVLDFTDMTLSTVQPLGYHSLAAQHLSKQGYKVLLISYKEYPQKEKLVKVVQYLQEKLKSVIN